MYVLDTDNKNHDMVNPFTPRVSDIDSSIFEFGHIAYRKWDVI